MLALHSATLSFAGSALGAPVRANMVATTNVKKDFCYGARPPRALSSPLARAQALPIARALCLLGFGVC